MRQLSHHLSLSIATLDRLSSLSYTFLYKLVSANQKGEQPGAMSGAEQPVKRTRMSGEERREAILRSAKQVFARFSYAEASTGELARASDVTEPMLYKHFGSKKGLFLAVLAESAEQFWTSFEQRVLTRAQKDLLDALAHVVSDYTAEVKADPDTQRILFQAVIETRDPEIAHCVSNHNRKIYQLIRQLVERAQQEGILHPAHDLDSATWGFASMILIGQYNLMLNTVNEVTRHQEEMSRIWLSGLRSARS